jgi:hypothetical protein
MNLATLFVAAALVSAPAIAADAATTTDHAHDFDFLVGKWNVHHWRLKDRLMNSHEWVQFDGTSDMRMTMNGMGTFDDNYIGLPSGPYWAVGIRGFDPKTQTWAIWWLDARQPHTLEPPVIGNFDFKGGVGTFEGDDTLRGKPVKVRFVWSKITANSAHWEQAFSPDGGKTWETNWRMNFTRAK